MSESDIIDLRAESHALGAMLQEAEGIASVTGAVEVGSEHVLMAFLLHKDLMVCRLLEVAVFNIRMTAISLVLSIYDVLSTAAVSISSARIRSSKSVNVR